MCSGAADGRHPRASDGSPARSGRLETSGSAELVAIPWRDDFALRGLYRPAAARAPAVACIAESRHTAEDLLAAWAGSTGARGLALLCVDLGSDVAATALGESRRPETCITAIVDFLIEQPGTDPDLIAIVADGSPSSLVARGVALDGRVAAAVCDAGVWDLWEHAQIGLRRRFLGRPHLATPRCPTFLALRPDDGIDAEYARRLLAQQGSGRHAVTVQAVGSVSGADGAVRGPAAATETILDWLCAQLLRQDVDPAS